MDFVLWPLLCAVMVGALIVVIRRIEDFGKIGPDRRYLELPPGTVPADGRSAAVGPSAGRVQIPVWFEPPRCSVAVAGLLLHGAVRGRDLAATLVELQRRKLIAIDDTASGRYLIRRLGTGEPDDVPSAALLAEAFRHGDRGPIDLADRDTLSDVAEAYASGVVRTATSQGWFSTLPDTHDRLTWLIPLVLGGVVGAAEIALFTTVAISPGLLTVGATNLLTSGRFRRGARTPDGRALTDQIEGFRSYLETAEADQLQFEAGEDLYARYLPWAVSFGIDDRWSAVCKEALKTDELPAFRLPPTWMLRAFFTIPREMPEE